MWNDEDNNPYGSFDRRDSSDNPHARKAETTLNYICPN